MITREKFQFIKKKYGQVASWAIWAEQGKTPKSNMNDMSVFDLKSNKELLNTLNPNIILVGLNFSVNINHNAWENFHKYRPHATDFKTRYALKGTMLWGAYMTDILKNYPESDSHKVNTHLKKHPELESKNIDYFLQEISDIGSENPVLFAFGNVVYSILKRNLGDFKIVRIPHYANHSAKEDYRKQVNYIINSLEQTKT